MDITGTLQRHIKRLQQAKAGMVRGLLKTLRHIEREKVTRVADLEEAKKAIQRELAELGHKFGVSKGKAAKTVKAAAKKSGKRVRRTPEQLKAEAVKIVAFIRSSGKDGAAGRDIRKKFPGVGLNIKKWIEQHTGEKIKTTGQKVKMRYHHS